MLYYDRLEAFERIGIDKMSALKEHNICHYWYFLNKVFKFQPHICSR